MRNHGAIAEHEAAAAPLAAAAGSPPARHRVVITEQQVLARVALQTVDRNGLQTDTT